MILRRWFLLAISLSLTGCAHDNPPSASREFRGAWVATVANIDWPSKPGLSVAQQQEEMLAILDRAVDLKLNAIIFQVRTSCDALYSSDSEPWSEYLTGRQGKAPDPLYDPLAMWVDEAHKRGLELHAWFNPYRARQNSAKSPECSTHISKTHPELVKKYGNYLWLDPGEPDAQAYTLRVIMDVVRRYDIDGVHIDDYFYPYPVKEAGGFPDEPSWQNYLATGGKLSRADWRRSNINHLIESIYADIKREKPWVKFGISPFGIWQPGNPAVVKGFNPYESLYADSKLWLNQGWCDYFTPQLYWKIDAPAQPYAGLLDWWIGQNTKHRPIVPGNYTSRINNTAASWSPQEILNQIEVTRSHGAAGNIHFSMKALIENRKGIADELRRRPYAPPALMPAAPWLGQKQPAAPHVHIDSSNASEVIVTWSSNKSANPWLWTIYIRRAGQWNLAAALPSQRTQVTIPSGPIDPPLEAIAVAAVSRTGVEGKRTVRHVDAYSEQTQSRISK